MNSIVDDLEAEDSDDFRLTRFAGEYRETGLPGGGFLSQLIDIVEGLPLERLVGRRVPGDLDRRYNLTQSDQSSVSKGVMLLTWSSIR